MRRLILVASVVAILSMSAAAQSTSPLTYVWRLDCPNGLRFGPYSTPDSCREERRTISLTCEQPTLPDGPKLRG